jgi:hypothetical protein
MRWDSSNLLSPASLGVLKSRAFFDDLRTLSFALHPLKKAISNLESRDCTLSDCFIGLAQLGAAIKKLSSTDHRMFRRQSITIFNKRFKEFNDKAYLLCFFLHPGYKGKIILFSFYSTVHYYFNIFYFTEIVFARGIFRDILLAADDFFEKMGKSASAREDLMAQMRAYRKRLPPFDVSFRDNESPQLWWSSIEDCFAKDEDYICQLAMKLFAITPHAAACERIWSMLGWYYGKRRVRLSLHKIESMQKLAAFYISNAKKELPYYGTGKTASELRKVINEAKIFDEDDDEDIIPEPEDPDTEQSHISEEGAGEEPSFEIEKWVNLDAEEFTSGFSEFIEDNENEGEEGDEEGEGETVIQVVIDNQDYEEWDPREAADRYTEE